MVFYYQKGVLCRKEPPGDDGIDVFGGIIGRRRRALIQVLTLSIRGNDML